MSRKYLGWIGFLILVFLITSYAWYLRILYNLKITALSQSSTSWGLWIAFYIFFVGLSAGAFLVSTLVYGFKLHQFEKIGRYALLIAIISLIGVFLSVLPDLGRMERFIYLYTSPQFGSWMAIEAWMYVIYIIILILELYLVSRWDIIKLRERTSGVLRSIYSFLSFGAKEYSQELHERDMSIVRVLALIGIPVAAIGVHGGTGAIFGVVGWRAIWYGAYTPIYFVLSAMFSGAALVLAFYVFTNKLSGKTVDKETVASLINVVLLLAFVELFFMFWEVVVNLWSTAPGPEKEVTRTMVFGPYWYVFWILEIIIGFAIPIGILLTNKSRENPLYAGVAGFLMVLGVIGIRFNIVLPSLSETPLPWMPLEWDIRLLPWPTIPGYVGGATQLVSNFSMGGIYFPTIYEWMLQFNIIALLLILYSIFVKLLPMEVVE